MKLYRSIMAKYAPKANANDGLNLYGVAKAWNVVQLLKAPRQEPDPRRADGSRAQDGVHAGQEERQPVPASRASARSRSGGFQYPITQVKLVKYVNHVFQPQGKLFAGRGALR